MSPLWIIAAFALFMMVVWAVHEVDDYSAAKYGYAPFAMPNVLFMLIPHGLLLFVMRSGGEQSQILVTLAGGALLAMLLLIRSRTSGWIALLTAPLLLLFAPVLVFSVLFRTLARAGSSQSN